MVLLSFGGLGLPGFDPAVLARMPAFTFLAERCRPAASGQRAAVATAALERAGLDYVDLVGAADVVVTKPGYGIVSDAIAAGTRMIYTDRGDFPEYPILVREMSPWLACTYVTNEELLRGAFGEDDRSADRAAFARAAATGRRSHAADRILAAV